MNKIMIPQNSLLDISPVVELSGPKTLVNHIIEWVCCFDNGMVREMDRKLGKRMYGRIGWKNGVKNWESSRNGI